MRTLSNFYQDLCSKYPEIEPDDWTIFVLNQDGYGFPEDQKQYHKTRATDCHIAFGGQSWSRDFAELETLATNNEGVICVRAKQFYETFAEEVSVTKNEQDPKDEALSVAERARIFCVTDQITFAAAGEIAKDIKRLQKEIDKTFEPIIAAANAAHREALAQRDKYLSPLKAGEKVIKATMADYIRAEERRIEEERRIADAQREQERKEYEKHRHEVSEDLFAQGRREEALAVKSAIMPEYPMPRQEAAPVADGISIRKTYRAEVVDFVALIKAIAEGNESLLAYIQPNQKALDAHARAAKSDTCYIPGVRFVVSDSVGVRA
jgi:hypothetical protein